MVGVILERECTKCLSRRFSDRIPRPRSQSVAEVADVLEKSPTPKLQTSVGIRRTNGKCLSRRLGDRIPRHWSQIVAEVAGVLQNSRVFQASGLLPTPKPWWKYIRKGYQMSEQALQ